MVLKTVQNRRRRVLRTGLPSGPLYSRTLKPSLARRCHTSSYPPRARLYGVKPTEVHDDTVLGHVFDIPQSVLELFLDYLCPCTVLFVIDLETRCIGVVCRF